MPNLPTISSTGWGTTLNTFLETAHDNGTDATKSGKVKPSGIIGGSTGQILTTDAGGIPTWGSASTNQTLYKLDTNIKVSVEDSPNIAIPKPAGFAYLLAFDFFAALYSGSSYVGTPIEFSLSLYKGAQVIRLCTAVLTLSRNQNLLSPAEIKMWKVPLPIDVTDWDVSFYVDTNDVPLTSFQVYPQVQIVWWNGQ